MGSGVIGAAGCVAGAGELAGKVLVGDATITGVAVAGPEVACACGSPVKAGVSA